jgi:hypothetical protein
MSCCSELWDRLCSEDLLLETNLPEKRPHILSFWSTRGKAKLLSARAAIDRSHAALGNGERAREMREAVGHVTLSLAYQGQVVKECFEVSKAEERLNERTLAQGVLITGRRRG